jgi:predicted TIM-barrel fold metal-dependent hydrolase
MEFIEAAMPRRLGRQLPAGACDTHNHVFGPFESYPLEHVPDYPMPLAPIETYLRMLDLAGLHRGVLVQPTQQDTDVTIMLDALEKAGGRLRGVAAARTDVTDVELDRMQRAGVSGLRFVEAPLPSGDPRPGAIGFDDIDALASRMRDRDWSIHVWARMPTLMENLDKLLSPALPVVFEHMGMPDVGEGVGGAYFQNMLALLREGRIWVKLSVCRCSKQAPQYGDLRPFTDALVEANPHQLLWGSDWPFIRMQGNEPDVSDLLQVLLDWIGDPDIERSILVDNPGRLFGFDDTGDAAKSAAD